MQALNPQHAATRKRPSSSSTINLVGASTVVISLCVAAPKHPQPTSARRSAGVIAMYAANPNASAVVHTNEPTWRPRARRESRRAIHNVPTTTSATPNKGAKETTVRCSTPCVVSARRNASGSTSFATPAATSRNPTSVRQTGHEELNTLEALIQRPFRHHNPAPDRTTAMAMTAHQGRDGSSVFPTTLVWMGPPPASSFPDD